MTPDSPPHPPRQQRSRDTADRLLKATIRMLADAGLEGAVIPRIAALANVAPASIYRRYTDKDALLRAAFLHVLEQSNEANREQLAALILRDTLAATARRLITVQSEEYQRNPKLLLALTRFIDMDTDQAFIAEARRLVAANLALGVGVLMIHSAEIAHAAPEAALRFAVLNAATTIESYAQDPHEMWHMAPAISAAQLTDHLVHGFVSFLTTAPAA
jgi:AcrR family transcriptional regulator